MAEDLVSGRNEAHGMWWPADDDDAARASGRLDWSNRRAPRLLLLNPPITAAVDTVELWFGTLARRLVHLIREWTPPGTVSIEGKAGEFEAIRNAIAHGTSYEGDMELRDAYGYLVQLLRAVLLLDLPPSEDP